MTLYPHNQKAYEAVMNHFGEGNKMACIVHATGTGKSVIIAEVSKHFERVLVLAPMTFVLNETRKVCGDNVDFMTYQSLLNSMPSNHYDLIVLDEFHRAGAEKWRERLNLLFSINADARIFGATATPDRNDGNNVCDSIFEGNVVSKLSLQEALSIGILPMPKAYVCGMYSFDNTFRIYSSRIGKADVSCDKRNDLRKRLNSIQNSWEKSEGVVSILRTYFDQDYHHRIIVFCPNIQKLKSMISRTKEWFHDAGITVPMKYYRLDSGLSDNVLSDNMTEYCTDEDGIIKVAFAVNMLNEGVHIPGVDCIICLRSTESHIIMYQQIGRCFTARGRQPLILDLVSNIDRLRSCLKTERNGTTPSSSARNSSNTGHKEVEEFPFKITAIGKDIIDELDSLNCSILGYYTNDDVLEKVTELAEQYEYLKDIPKEYNHIIQLAYKRLGSSVLHKYIKPYRSTYYPIEEILEVARRYKTPTEWKHSDDHKYYLYVQKHKLVNEIYTVLGWSIRTPRTYEDCLESARKYETYKEWDEKEPSICDYARRHNWNTRIMRELFSKVRRMYSSYTKDECAEIARRYKSPKEFRKGNSGVWEATKLNGWVLDICSHMPGRSLWPYLPELTYDECLSLSKNYRTCKQMRINNYRLYRTIVKNHWEGEMFSHFPRHSLSNRNVIDKNN